LLVLSFIDAKVVQQKIEDIIDLQLTEELGLDASETIEMKSELTKRLDKYLRHPPSNET